MRNSKLFKIHILSLVLIISIIAACANKKESKSELNKIAIDSTAISSGVSDSAGGITWIAPSTWIAGQDRPMRIKTYIIKAQNGDTDNGECGVFYFSGGGGDKNANLQRWAEQFERQDGGNALDSAKVSEISKGNLKITTVDIKGTYKLASGMNLDIIERKPRWHLMGAIVESPEGIVFFKMIGPENTVAASSGDFANLISSIRAK